MMKFGWFVLAFGVLWAGCKSAEEPVAQDSGTPAPAEPAAAAPTFASVQPIFQKSCVGCHGENGKHGVDLRTYESVMKGSEHGPIVKPGDPAGSELVEVLRTDDKDHRMPMGLPPLPTEEIEQIEAWIAAGAKGA
jgi:mono/diheme cytochrome c family protein